MTSKVLKVLKVLNFSGDGEGNTFTCPFTGDDPHPSPLPVRMARGICCGGQSFPARISRSSNEGIRRAAGRPRDPSAAR